MWAFMQEGYEANPEAFAYMVLFALEVLAGLAVAAFASIYELYFPWLWDSCPGITR